MNKAETLKVNEIFTSIQGEGIHTGRPMHFIRLSGCNLDCVYCDTRDNAEGETFTLDDILEQISDPSVFPVYITGGEPLLQESTLLLIIKLLSKGREVHLDTSGSVDLSPVAPNTHLIVDMKTPGSGASGSFKNSNLKHIQKSDEIKFIVTSKEDFNWALDKIDKMWLFNITPNLMIQPAWGMVEYKNVVEWLKESQYPIRLSAQLHKYIWGPDVKGV